MTGQNVLPAAHRGHALYGVGGADVIALGSPGLTAILPTPRVAVKSIGFGEITGSTMTVCRRFQVPPPSVVR